MKPVVAMWIALVAIASCRTPLPRYDYSKEPDPRRGQYVMGVGDMVAITVWKNPDLATEGPVRPDGTLTMPLLGDLHASGRTTGDLKDEITRKLADYITDTGAVVSVQVREVNSYRFTVSGEVVQQGVFSSQSYVTVADAIAMAGGFTRFAQRDRIVILRHDDKGARRIPLDYDAILSGKRPDMNLVLLAGDSVLVP